MAKIASDRQIAFLKTLRAEREGGEEFARKYIANTYGPLTSAAASAIISTLLQYPKIQGTEEVAPEPEVGVYIVGATIIKVQENRAKTNRYTMVWEDISGSRLTLADEHVHGEWHYAPQFKSQVTEAHRMSLEQAKRFTLVFGQCAKCGRTLKAAESVEQGIGPVCRKYFRI